MDFGDAGRVRHRLPDLLGRRPRPPATASASRHIAFKAPDRAAVRAFFDAAVAAGAEVLHEPRIWPEYHESYFGAFVRDPDGNNVEAVCHRPNRGRARARPRPSTGHVARQFALS